MRGARLLSRESEEVDDVAVLATPNKTARIAVGFDDIGQAGQPVAERLDFGRFEAKALVYEVHALEADSAIGEQPLRAHDAGADGQISMNGATLPPHANQHFSVDARRFIGDLAQIAFAIAQVGDVHGDAHIRAVGVVNPRMIGDHEAQADRVLALRVAGCDRPIEGLSQAVRRDEAKALRLPGAYQLRRMIPSVHHDICASAAGCPHFGLPIGQRAGVSALGPVADVVRQSGSVREALHAFIAHMHLINSGAIIALHQRSGLQAEIVLTVYHRDMRGGRRISDGGLALTIALMQSFCDPQWKPSEVTFPNSRPPNVTPYRKCFGAPLRFDCSHAAIVFPVRCLDQPLTHGEQPQAMGLARKVAEMESSSPASPTECVCEALSSMLVDALPSVDGVARVLGLSRRTLNRQLATEGTCVRGLLEDLRCAMGRQLLEETQMPISEIAATLHHTTPNAFSRAFAHWNGSVNPRTCRSAVQADDAILAAAKRSGTSIFHTSGTCRMGQDSLAVVDPRLRVRGVTGLRVADASVMPALVSGNSNAAVMAIGWRASDLILADA